MSNAGGAASPSDGVVRNSALSFVASATAPVPAQNGQDIKDNQEEPERLVPAGLKALCEVYSRLYPDQMNPLQVTTRLKYWLGGQDPLDYISMYWNPGKPEENIPPHWHYVSFGLSDLHGDGRVHAPPDKVLLADGQRPPSGCGAELSFRLEEAGPPPLWPAALLQALARYVHTTGNKFCAGDHISWHRALDGGAGRIRHLLVANDPRLPTVDTPHGTVTFLQMVGCTSRELKAAQRGSGFDVLKQIADDPKCGGEWLVTRLRRGSARGVCGGNGAAHLAGVTAGMRWERWTPSSEEASDVMPASVQQQIKDTLRRGLSSIGDGAGQQGHTGMSTDSFEMSSIERALPQVPELMQGSWRGEETVEYLEGVHLQLNPEAASLLPLAIDGRVIHDRHFTWRCAGRAATVLSAAVGGAFASNDEPIAARGGWLQVLIPRELADDMSEKVSKLSKLCDTDSESESEGASEAPVVPLTLTWPKYRLKISVVHDHELL